MKSSKAREVIAMGEAMSLTEIRARFKSEWILLEDPETTELLEVKGGTARELIAMVKSKYRIYILLSLAALFSGQIAANPTIAEITRGPYLSDVTKTSVIISWETEQFRSSVVQYATDVQYNESGYDQRARNRKKVRRHSIILRDLIPSTLYHYRVISGLDVGMDNTFHTAVEWFEPFTLAAYGDTRTNHDNHQLVVNRMVEHEPDLVIHSGDLVADGWSLPQWDIFFDITKELMRSVPYYPVLGNHEGNARHYYNLFYLPAGGGREGERWYSFNYGNAHFVCLDSNVRHSIRQLAWLERDLAQVAAEAQWIFVNFHHPPYSSGKHGSEYATMTRWLDAFERYGVDMVFSGHDHIYERSFNNGIWYIVTGGGGAPLYDINENPNPYQVYAEKTLHFCKLLIDGERLTFEMIREDGTIGDSITITKPVGAPSVNRPSTTWGKMKAGGQDY